MRASLFVLGLLVLLTWLGGTAMRLLRGHRAAARNTLGQLLDTLQPVNKDAIARIASETATADGLPMVQPDEIWNLVGGMACLDALEQNCKVLIELASHLQERYPEVVLLAETLRLNTRQIEWHIGRLRSAQHTGHLRSAFPDYAQQAIRLYHAMTTELLAAFEGLDPRGFAEVQMAV